jgi:integrase
MRTVGTVYRRGKVWQIKFIHRGKRYRESSGSTDRKVAVALLKHRLAEVISGRIVGPSADRATFQDLVDLLEGDYAANARKSTRSMRCRVKRLRQTFGSTRPVDITHAMLTAYVTKRQGEGAKPATVRYELGILGRAYNLAMKAGMLVTRPLLPQVKVSNARKGFVTEEEFGRLLSHLPADLAPAIAFAYTTGWRIGEVRALRWSAVNFAEGVVRIEADAVKNEEPKTFPFAAHDKLRSLLERQHGAVMDLQRTLGAVVPWVFPRATGQQLYMFRRSWDRACKLAGIPGRVPHDLRRSAVRNLERAGISRSVAMKLTGHKTEAVYRRYAIVSEADLAEAVKRLSSRA